MSKFRLIGTEFSLQNNHIRFFTHLSLFLSNSKPQQKQQINVKISFFALSHLIIFYPPNFLCSFGYKTSCRSNKSHLISFFARVLIPSADIQLTIMVDF